MRNDNEWLPGRNAEDPVVKNVLGMIGLGMGVGQHISAAGFRDELTDYGQKVADLCDEVYNRWTRFHFGNLERPGSDVGEARRYEFEVQGFSIEVVDFGELNLDGAGFWHRFVAVSFEGNQPEYLTRRVTV